MYTVIYDIRAEKHPGGAVLKDKACQSLKSGISFPCV